MTRTRHDDQALDSLNPSVDPARPIAPGRMPASARILPSALFRKARDANGVAAGAEEAVDRAASASGRALPGGVREQFEGSLGADLSSVRVHTGDESAQAADAVGARAYTVGNDIHFADGQYAPSDPFGLHLLAHEVAHTQQQAGATPHRQNQLEVSSPGDSAEREADRAADAMVVGEATRVGTSSGLGRKVMRDPKPAQQGAPPAAQPTDDQAKNMDCSTVVMAIGQAYQTLMEKQIEGINRIEKDAKTKQDPTVADEIIKAAVIGALTLATAMLAEAIIGAVVAGAVEAKILADQAAKGVAQNADKAVAAADKAAAAAAASSTAKFLVDKAKAGTTAAATAQFKDSGASTVIDLFVENARDALITAKQQMQNAANASLAQYQASPYGHAQAATLLDGVNAQEGTATETQYMAALSQLNSMHGSGVSGWTVVIAPYQLGGKPVVKSAALGCNETICHRLQSPAFSGFQLKDFPLAMIVRIAGSAQAVSLSGSTDGQVGSFPDDGPGQHMLAEFFPSDPSKAVPENQIGNQARNAAFIIWGDVQQLTIKQLGAFGTG